MSAYSLETVIEMWRTEQLTEEQAIGQILLLLRELHERLGELERRVSELARGRVNE